jgi:Protein of unknown function (DUF3224)
MGMKVRLWSAVAVVALSALGATSFAAAEPSTSMTLTGTWTGTDATLLGLKFAGPNVFVSFDAVAVYSGDVVGTSHNPSRVLLRPDGSLVGEAVETITGLFAGIGTGTLTLREEFRSSDGGISGRGTVIGATGDLAGMHGTAVFLPGSYELDLNR